MPEYYTTPITQFYKPENKEKEPEQAPFFTDRILSESPMIPTNEYEQIQFLNETNNQLNQSSDFLFNLQQQKIAQEEAESANPLNMAKNLVGGFLEGFTTIDIIDEPSNQYDAISYSLGHFLGFAGWVPMPGKIGGMIGKNLKNVASLLPKQANSALVQSMGQRFLSGEATLKSVPVLAADWIMKGVNKYVFGDAKSSALKIFKEGSKVKDIAEGALHLGFASAVSADEPWKPELQKRFEAFLGGAEAGAVFRGIGNVIGRQSGNSLLDFSGGGKDQLGNNVARMLAGSLYMGVPSTLAGEPTMFQIYNYIQGAGFGFLEHSAGERHANSMISGLYKDKKENVLMLSEEKKNELISGYKDASQETKDIMEQYRGIHIAREINLGFKEALEDEKLLGITGDHSLMKHIKEFPTLTSIANIVYKGFEKAGGKIETKPKEVDEATIEDFKAKIASSDEHLYKIMQEKFNKNEISLEKLFEIYNRRNRINDLLKIKDIEDIDAQGEVLYKSFESSIDDKGFWENIFKIKEESLNEMLMGKLDVVKFEDSSLATSYTQTANNIAEIYKQDILNTRRETNPEKLNNEVLDKTKTFINNLVDYTDKIRYVTSNKYGKDLIAVENDIKKKLTDPKATEETKSDLYEKLFKDTQVKFPAIEINNKVVKDYYITDLIDSYIKDTQDTLPKNIDSARLVKSMKNFFQRIKDRSFSTRYEFITKDGKLSLREFQDTLSTGKHVGKTTVSTFHSSIQKVIEIAYMDGKPLLENVDDISKIIPNILKVINNDKDLAGKYFILGGGHHNRSLFLVKNLAKKYKWENGKTVPLSEEFTYFDTYKQKEYDAREIFPNLLKIGKSRDKDKVAEYFSNSFSAFYPNIEKKYSKQFFLNLLDGKTPEVTEEYKTYINNYVNNLIYYERINGKGYLESLKEEGSIKNVIDFIKRNKLTFYGDTSIPYSIFRGVDPLATGYTRDAQNNITGFNSVLFNVNYNGKERLIDGAVYMLKEDIDKVRSYFDIDPGTIGFLKSTQLGDSFIGKNGIHEAPTRLDAYMRNKGIRMMFHTTAAKVYGNRKVETLDFHPFYGYNLPGSDVNKFNIDIGKISFIPSSTPNNHLTHNQNIPIQFFSSLMKLKKGQVGTISNLKKVFETSINGIEFDNTEYKKLKSKEYIDSYDIAKIDFDKLSVTNIGEIIRDYYSSNSNESERKIFNAFLKHANKLIEKNIAFASKNSDYINNEGDPNLLLNTDVDEVVSMLGDVNNLGNLVKTLTSLDKELMSGTLQLNQGVVTNFNNFLKKYLMTRAFNPVIENSLGAIITPHAPEHRLRFFTDNNDYESGVNSYFYLGSGFKGKKITYDRPEGKVVDTLENIYNKAKTYNDPYAIKIIEDMTVARVPIDSIPGIAHGKFAGFTDEQGYGIHLSERDMAHLGGADVDADKTFVFFGLPEEYTKIIKDNRHEWEDVGITRSGHKMSISALPAYSNGKDMSIFDVVGMKNRISNEEKDPIFIFDPAERVKVSSNSYNGNKMLGFIINRLVAASSYANLKDESQQTLDLLSLIKRDGINMAADAKGDGTPSMNDVNFILYEILNNKELKRELYKINRSDNKTTKEYYTKLMAKAQEFIKKGYENGKTLEETFGEKGVKKFAGFFKEDELFSSVDFLLKVKNNENTNVHNLMLEVKDNYKVIAKHLKDAGKIKDMEDHEGILNHFPSLHIHNLKDFWQHTDGTTPTNIAETINGSERSAINRMYDIMHKVYTKFPAMRDLFHAFGIKNNPTGQFAMKTDKENWSNISDTKTMMAFISSIPKMFGVLEIAKKGFRNETEIEVEKAGFKKGTDLYNTELQKRLHSKAIRYITEKGREIFDVFITPTKDVAFAVNLTKRVMRLEDKINDKTSVTQRKKDELLNTSILLNTILQNKGLFKDLTTYEEVNFTIDATKGSPLVEGESFSDILDTFGSKNFNELMTQYILKSKLASFPDTYTFMKELTYFKGLKEKFDKLDDVGRNILVTLSSFNNNSPGGSSFRTIKERIQNKIKLETGDTSLKKYLERVLSHVEDIDKKEGGEVIKSIEFTPATKEDKSLIYEVYHNPNDTVSQLLDFLHPGYKRRDIEFTNNFFHYINTKGQVDPQGVNIVDAMENIYGVTFPKFVAEYLTPLDAIVSNQAINNKVQEKVGLAILERFPEIYKESGENFNIASAREQELVDRTADFFRLFFQRFPQWSNNFDVVSKLLSGTLEEFSFSSKGITSMNYDDLDLSLKKSIDILNNKRKLVDFERKYFYKMPVNIGKSLLGDDTQITDEIGRTPLILGFNKNGEPIIGEGKVRYWDSTFGIIHKLHQNSGFIANAIISKHKDELNEDVLYLLTQIEGKEWYKDFMRYLIFNREGGLEHEIYKKNKSSLLTVDKSGTSVAQRLANYGEQGIKVKNRETGKIEDRYVHLIPMKGATRTTLFDVLNNELTTIFKKYGDRYINDPRYKLYKKEFHNLLDEDIKNKNTNNWKMFKEKYSPFLKLYPLVKEKVGGRYVTMLDLDNFTKAWETVFMDRTVRELPSMNILDEAMTLFHLGNSKNIDGVLIKDIKNPENRRLELAKILLEKHSQGRTILDPNGEAKYIETIDPDKYYPHKNHDEAISKAWIEDMTRKIVHGKKSIYSSVSVIDSLNRAVIGDISASDPFYYNRKRVLTEKDLDEMGTNRSPKSLRNRNDGDFGPMPGWSLDHTVLYRYIEDMTNGTIGKLSALVSHNRVRDFERYKPFGETTQEWSDFMDIYIQQALGLPAYYPSEFINSRGLKLTDHPFYKLTEQYWFDKAQKEWPHIFGTEFSPGVTWESYDRHLRDMKRMEIISAKITQWKINESRKGDRKMSDIGDKEAQDAINLTKDEWGVINNYASDIINREKMSKITNFLRNTSSLEGKWSIATLLFDPTSGIANWTTSHINTAINVGIKDMIKGRSLKTFRQLIGKHNLSREDMNKMAQDSGAIESFLKNEVEFAKQRQEDLTNMVNDISKFHKQKKTGVIEEGDAPLSIGIIARKYNVVDRAVEKAAWFMRSSEILGRNDAWFAHYYNAYKSLNANNFSIEWDHPWLIRQANKGVRETQFLYDSASKPLFMSTSLGKIFTRFQNYLWNSVNWRREIYSSAAEMGFSRNSESFTRLQRLMAADMFILALASLFPVSLFSKTVPQPWDYFVNLSNFMFGNDEEREGAFYGSLPYPANLLQPVLPPSSRYLTNVFSTMVSGDVDKLSNYYMWSWFPGGKMVKKINHVIHSPSDVLDKVTGIPLKKMDSKIRKEEEETPEQTLSAFKSAFGKLFPNQPEEEIPPTEEDANTLH